MDITPFKLERYFAQYEFNTRWLLSSSDCDGLEMNWLLAQGDDETRAMWNDLRLGYTESPGHPLLRAEIAGFYDGLAPQDVLTVVPEEGIFIAINCLLRPGEHAICTFPGYQSLYQIAQDAGCQVTRWLPDENENWRFNPHFLEESIQPNTRLLVINFPQNPTGALPTRADYERLLDIARRHGLYVLSDEMYRLLELDEAERLPPACTLYERAISLAGMSKAFGLAGLRLGWLATQDRDLMARMAAFKDYTTICGSAPSEILALMALRAKEGILALHMARIRRNLALLDDFFERQAGLFRWNRPRAGTVAFPRYLGAEGAAAFCQRAIKEAGVLLLPATVYDFGDAHFRLGFGRENFHQGLERLDIFLL